MNKDEKLAGAGAGGREEPTEQYTEEVKKACANTIKSSQILIILHHNEAGID
jgi:hypothetical protein